MSERTYIRNGGCSRSFLDSAVALFTVFPVSADRQFALRPCVHCYFRNFRSSLHLAWRSVWAQGRPVLFLTLLCIGAASALLFVSMELSLVFVIAAAAALATFYHLATWGSVDSTEK